ncbi:MAG: type II toxin-antitoxin system PemK/MazF family toxin [Polaribacter sp.]
MKKGDIVLVPFPFTDLKGSKKRPALILYVGTLDTTVCFISSKLYWEEDIDLILEPTKENGLKVKSLVKTSKIATIDKVLIIGKLGNVNYHTLVKIDENLIKLFKIENYPKTDKV